MSTKSFRNIRKPARQPTAEEIAGFEVSGRAGPPHAAANASTQKTVSAEIRADVKAEIQEPSVAQSRESVDTEAPIPPEPMARLTVDLPETVHLRFKVACARSRRKMVQELRDFIERRTVELEGLSG